MNRIIPINNCYVHQWNVFDLLVFGEAVFNISPKLGIRAKFTLPTPCCCHVGMEARMVMICILAVDFFYIYETNNKRASNQANRTTIAFYSC